MPLLRHKSSSPSPLRPTTTAPSSPPSDMQLKGVKRIVSGLKRRISYISLRGHIRHHDGVPADAHPSPVVLGVVPDHEHPITFPVSPRTHASVDTLTRSVSAGGLGKHYSDSEESSSSSSGHSRFSSADSSFHEAHLISEHQVESSLNQPSEGIPENRWSIASLSSRLPPPESLTAPLEAFVPPAREPSPSLVEKKSIVSFESLTAPLETLVLPEDIRTPVDQRQLPITPSIQNPWEVPLPPLEPCDFALPGADDDGDSIFEPAPPTPIASTLPEAFLIPEHSDSLPSADKASAVPTSTSLNLLVQMDPLGVAQPSLSAAVESGAATELLSSTLDSQLSASMEVQRETPLFSPPAPVGEPEVPNPFIEDPDAELSEDVSVASESMAQSILAPAAEEIALAPPPAAIPLPRSPNFNKSMPPTPAPPSDDEDEDDVPELYLPGLTLPTMFLPIPNTDALSTLLTKYIPAEKRPPRDLSGDYARFGGEIHPLVMTNSWRAVAKQARDRIVEADPEDVPFILSLWYLRLSSLARMRLFNQTAAECTNLFTVLHAIEPPATQAFLFERVMPFELEVLYAKLKYWAGDHMGYLDTLAALLQRCKLRARVAKADQVASAMWAERGSRVCLIIASQLIEMKDFAAAARVLEPLCLANGNTTTSPALRSAVARVYLQGGYVAMAAKHFAAVAEDPTADPAQKAMNAALYASAEGDWQRAASELQKILAADPENFVAVNNLAVALLNQGRLREGIEVLEGALRASPATIVTAEPFLFNLSTMYELRSSSGADKKRELLVEVAKWAGDGLRTTCLKMPTS